MQYYFVNIDYWNYLESAITGFPIEVIHYENVVIRCNSKIQIDIIDFIQYNRLLHNSERIV